MRMMTSLSSLCSFGDRMVYRARRVGKVLRGALRLPFAGLRLGEPRAPVGTLADQRERGEGEQEGGDAEQAERDRALEEDQVIAVRHDQRLAQALLEDRRDNQAEH